MNKRKAIFIALKILLPLVLIAGTLFLSFWVMIIGSFTGNYIFGWSGFALTILGVPLIVISFYVKRKIQLKQKVYLWIGLFILLLSPNVISECYKYYHSSFKRMGEGVEVLKYQPFANGTKAVYLNESSLLRLAEPLPKLDGARALYPVYSAFAQAVYPKKTYNYSSEVGYTNTINAYKRLITRDADIIFVVSPSKEQLKSAQNEGVKIKFTAIGQDAFVFFVNSKNPINHLTTKQIQDIYSGKITNWAEVGGNNQPIKAFQRNEGSGSQSAFIKFMQGNTIMPALTEDAVQGMGKIIEQTANYANYANSIGFSFRYFSQTMIANNEIKLLSIDGIYPSVETIASGAYPVRILFYAATLEDNNKSDIKKMIEWILSPQGQQIIEKTGYVKIK